MIYVPRTPQANEAMMRWAAKIIKQEPFERYQCLGFVIGGKMACIVVAHDYSPPNCLASIASVNPKWCTRGNIRVLEDWFFRQLKCTRVTGLVDPRNAKARKLDEGLGFKLEGTLRRARPDGGKLLVYGLIKDDLERFLRKKREQTKGPESA